MLNPWFGMWLEFIGVNLPFDYAQGDKKEEQWNHLIIKINLALSSSANNSKRVLNENIFTKTNNVFIITNFKYNYYEYNNKLHTQ